jgi:maleate cis-trans isomerase
MEERVRAYREGLAGPTAALSQVRPAVVLLAHTASSYALGYGNEQTLMDRIASLAGAPALLAAQAVLAALRHLGVKRLALGTPYPESISRQGKAYWEAAGFEIAGYHRLENVTDIYAENEERAYELARRADAPEADAVLLSGTGLPTVAVLETLERDLGKPVLSSNQASLWQALRMARVRESIAGYGRLLREV